MTETCSNASEELALNKALEEAGPLLAESLQRDELARRRKRRLIAGGLVMLVLGASFVATLVLATGEPNSPNPVAEVKAYQSAIDSGALRQKGWRLWSEGYYSEAAQVFFEAIMAEPESADLWNGLGWSLFHTGKHDKAADAFKEALKLEENQAGALNGMGQIAFAKKDYKQAKEWFLKAPHAPAAQVSLVKTHLLLSEYDEAEALSGELVAQLPEDSTDENIQTQRAWLTQLHDAAAAKQIPDALQQQLEPAPPAEPVEEDADSADGPARVNLLKDGGVERGTEGWIIGSNSGRMQLSPDKETKTEGEQSLRITKTGGMPIDILRINCDDLTPGQKVTVSARIKAQDVGNAWMKFFVWDAEGNVLIKDIDVARIHGTYHWRTAKKRFTIPEGTAKAAIQFWMILDGTIWVDDVRIEPVE